MRTRLILIALWLIAAVGVVAISWQGVRVGDDGVLNNQPTALVAPSDTSRATADTPSPVGQPAAATPNTSAATTPPTTLTTTVDGTQPAPPPSNPTTTLPPTTTTVPPTTTSPPETRLYNLVGGATSISFSPNSVAVLWVSPNPGFTGKIETESAGIKVEFESDDHESRVDAWWDNGPRDRIREEG